jgi:hypothetical protein
MSNTRLFQARNDQIRSVKVGFNWFAFVLGALWAFGNRGWILGIALVAASVGLLLIEVVLRNYVGGAMADIVALVLYVGSMFACGRWGNAWLARTLQLQGYREIKT